MTEVYRTEQRGQHEKGMGGAKKTKGTDGTKKKTKQRRECKAPPGLSQVSTRWGWKDARVCRELWGHASAATVLKPHIQREGKKKLADLSPQGSLTAPASGRVRQLVPSQAPWLPPPRNEEHTEQGWT